MQLSQTVLARTVSLLSSARMSLPTRIIAATSPPTPQPLLLTFVCTGNICRSPTAEIITRTLLTRAGLHHHVLCESSGTHGHDGWSADSRSNNAAADEGFSLDSHKARSFNVADFDRCDFIFALDSGHADWLRRAAPTPAAAAKIALVMSTASDTTRRAQNIEDPYYDDTEAFIAVVEQCLHAATGLVAILENATTTTTTPATTTTLRNALTSAIKQ
jgi:protein-tyrosine phosphatase